jgi:hypothetical protein
MYSIYRDERNIIVEHKEIQEDVYEAVNSFSNYYGGYIITEVKNRGIPIGT